MAKRAWIGWILALCLGSGSALADFQHGICLYGTPKYSAGFEAFAYVNPDAPLGGSLRQATFSAFNSLNPFILMGMAPAGIGLTHDTLMKQSADENFCAYGLVADGIEVNPDKSVVAFHLNPKARFNDGTLIQAEDVVFSFNILREKGLPAYRYYYADVERVETPDVQTVRFHLKPNAANKELPLILGELPVLSKAYWEGKNFEKTTLEVPVSSGPYLISDMDVGRSITYQLNKDYWAKKLNVNRGFYNFETVRFDLYRDSTVAVEAFKSGLFDVRMENEAKKWMVFKNYPDVLNGHIQRREFEHHLPSGMQGFVFNTRRPIFQNPNVRAALAYAFDFNFVNQFLFYGLYKRTNSYFDNSIFKADGIPTGLELALLEPYRDQLAPALFNQPYQAPERTGNIRRNLGIALGLLGKAGWIVKDSILVNEQGQPFQFEILIDAASAPTWERVILPFIGQLKRLGITATLRVVDSIQYKNRLDAYDYDMIVSVWGQSLAPGNEQRYFWGSEAAQQKGSYNYAGIQNKVVDDLIEKIISAQSKEEHLAAVKALDRVLLWGHYVIPHWHTPVQRYLFWNKFGIPQNTPLKGVDLMTWWDQSAEIK